MRNVFAILMVVVGVQGCAFFTKPLEQPVIEEKLNSRWLSKASVGTLSLTPERRVVLVSFRNNRFCAEAPTEIGIDLASAISANIGAKQLSKSEIEAAIKSALSSKNSVLNKRTQGMQLFLANSYFACQMYMNGGIDERQLLEMQFQTLKMIEPLIFAEIKLMYQNNGENGAENDDKNHKKSSDAIKSDVNKTVTDILKEKSAKPAESPQPEPSE